jgi:8-oxo-dGTP pyrophosphatase MutT (NUDIX family)
MAKKYQSVGILIVARDTNRFLMLHRVNHPKGTWSALAGGMEGDEDPVETVKREIREEIGVDASMVDDIRVVGTSNAMGHTHYVMIGFVDREFKVPNLKKDENDKYGWFSYDKLPHPLHPGFLKSLEMIKPFLDLRESFKKGFNKLINE